MGEEHRHGFYKLYEEFLLGGQTLAGWECACGEFVSQTAMPPTGLDGDILDEQHLVGPHGGQGNCSDGSVYKRQVYKDGKLTIER